MKSSPPETSGLRSAVQTRRSARFPKASGALPLGVVRPSRPSPKRLAGVVGPSALKDSAQSQKIRSLKEQAQIHFKNKKTISPVAKPAHKPPETLRASLSPELPPPLSTTPHPQSVSPVGLPSRPLKVPVAPFRANLVAKVATASPLIPARQKSDFTGPLTFEEIMLRKKKAPEDVTDVAETPTAGQKDEDVFMIDQLGSRRDPVIIELANENSGEDIKMELEGETEFEEGEEEAEGNLEAFDEKDHSAKVREIEGEHEELQVDESTLGQTFAEEDSNINEKEQSADDRHQIEVGEQNAEVGVWNSFQHYKQSQISRKRNKPDDTTEETDFDKPEFQVTKHVKIASPVIRLVLELISNLQTAFKDNKEIDPQLLQDFTCRWNADASERVFILREICEVLEAENRAILNSAKLSPTVSTYPKSLVECAEWVSRLESKEGCLESLRCV
eukprot:GHVP01028961.1.p1 GENE.GHVP01028961.1~~GHVP01028961.1.p1  ORF type:complete len:446 (-),score=95.68 GHVP01028961.1:1829-3166(-)